MKKFLLFVLLLDSTSSFCQDSNSIFQIIANFQAAGSIADSLQRESATEKQWKELVKKHIPYVVGDSAAFFYRGIAKSVDWIGDFNGWGHDKAFKNKGRLITGTDIWVLTAAFPRDARLDYKIILNGGKWILDPENTYQQWSGVGGGSPNSELRMPDWKEDPILKVRRDIPHGEVIDEILFSSKILGYQITYSIYLPPGINPKDKLSCLYVTDGYEYMQPRLGNMVTVIDNLLADKKIKPIVAVFVDNREPVNRSNNKRMEELAMNPKYLEFFINELIPYIQSHYPVDTTSSSRAIMGASMGGLTAAYFAFSKPGVFGMAGIQSPAFWVRPQIYTLCDNPSHPIKVSMTSGLISDASEGSQKMKAILQTNACVYHYKEVNDGHSWGNWRNLIDDVLIDLFGN